MHKVERWFFTILRILIEIHGIAHAAAITARVVQYISHFLHTIRVSSSAAKFASFEVLIFEIEQALLVLLMT